MLQTKTDPVSQYNEEFQQQAERDERVRKIAESNTAWRMKLHNKSDFGDFFSMLADSDRDLLMMAMLQGDSAEVGRYLKQRMTEFMKSREQYILDDEMINADREEP